MTFSSNAELVKCQRTYLRCDSIHPRNHAKDLDKQFGFRIPKIENKLQQKYRAYYQDNDDSNKKQHYKGTQTWIGLHPQALQTPYNDIFEVLYLLKDFEVKKIIDIGAGYGRVGLVMSSIFPDARFIGYEILKKRADEANRIYESLNLINCEILLQNVLEDGFQLPEAEIYFIYDFSELEDLIKILDQLVNKISKKQFFLITRGDRIDFLLEKQYKEFWLSNGYLSSGELKIFSSKTDLTNFK